MKKFWKWGGGGGFNLTLPRPERERVVENQSFSLVLMYFTFVVLFQNVVYIRNTVDVEKSGQLFYFKNIETRVLF